MEINQIFNQVKVLDYSYQGLGVVKINNFTIFVPSVKQGETIDIEVVDIRKSFAFGRVINQEVPKVKCPYYYDCGGCNIMHLNYDEQLSLKENTIQSQMHKHMVNGNFECVSKSTKTENYRNKITMPINYIDGQLRLGFYRASSHRFTPVNNCLIANESINNLIAPIEDVLNKLGEFSYNYKTNRGNLRHLIIRGNEENIMVILVTKTGKIKNVELFIDLIKNLGVSSIVINKQPNRTRQVLGTENTVIFGSDSIKLPLLKSKFEVLPSAFFQVNKDVTDEIIKYIQGQINFTNKNVLDAFCGTGTLGQLLASEAKSVTGIEIEKQAVAAAIKNANNLNLDNCKYICGDIETVVKANDFDSNFDIALVDPPRSGMAAVLKSSLLTIKPKHIVYIACDPSTMMRDISELKLNYEVINVRGFDMFPNTHHVETVAIMKLREE